MKLDFVLRLASTRSVAASLCLAFAANLAPAQALVDDAEPGLDRLQAPGAGNAQWLLGAGLIASDQSPALEVRAGSAPGSFLAYFTSPGYPATIAIGETLSASLVFSLSQLGTANGVTALRLALLDSGGSRAADGFNTAGKIFAPYAGYAALMSTRGHGTGLTIRERVTGSNFFLNSTDNPPFTSPVPQATGPSQAFMAATRYTATLSATRTNIDRVEFRVTLSGGNFRDYSVAYMDTVTPTLSFDTVGFGWARNFLADGAVLTVDSLRVSLSGGAPPASE